MHCVTNIHEDLYWLGGSDRQLAKFENVFPIPRGVSYNAYLVLDEKTVLLDTVDKAVGERFFENLEFALAGRPLDYVVVNHMEPDHCATLGELLRRWPGAQVVANAKTVPMVSQFFDCDISNRAVVVKEGDTLCTGRHTFTFLMAPMVHWPEVLMTYDETDRLLLTADAFGCFGALNGRLFADVLVESAAEIVRDVVFSVRKSSRSAETAHNGTALAMDTGFDFHSVNGTFSLIQHVARLKNSHFQVPFLFHQLVGSKNPAGACADDDNIICFHLFTSSSFALPVLIIRKFPLVNKGKSEFQALFFP
mgnify:CR=1 FL=1